jgi:glycine/D-amino acid oxidase-like deaminating enzyme/nitrite reductase/ring-hydroxylating ferredoxin subunit
MAATSKNDPRKFMQTSGITDPVWIHLDPFTDRSQPSPLKEDIETEVCIVGAGISGISIAYELVSRGHEVTLIEARDVLSGETGRTSGHLASALDDGYVQIKKKHGLSGAKAAAESHVWAIDRVGEISKALGIDCEYRKLNAYQVSQHVRGTKEHEQELQELKKEVEQAQELGLDATFDENLTIKGWDGEVDQRGGATFANQATFHPTQYVGGVLKWLNEQPKFQLFTNTRMMSVTEEGLEMLGFGRKVVKIETESGHTIKCDHAVEATCSPLQKLSIIVEMEYYRTYCIAIRVPKKYIEDCLLYDVADAYKYIRLTACDESDDYLVVGGGDHKVGQEETTGRFEELEEWTRERFTKAGIVDYKWSGEVLEPVDHVAFIGLNQGMKHTYVVTGDSGNGLTHGVLAGRLIADEIEGSENPWSKLYNPSRLQSIVKSLPSMVSHDIQVNAQYKRFLQTDITDIEDLGPGCGGVLNVGKGNPIAVYKDEKGNVEKLSALCPHLKGVVCWNAVEKSWDCPIHGSRFSKDGICVQGPAFGNLNAVDDAGKEAQKITAA